MNTSTAHHAQQCPAVDGFGCHCDEYTNTAAILAATVDQLAEVKSHIATLQKREDELKQILAAAGPDIIEGTNHRAAVTITARTAINWQAIAEHLKPSRQLITAHTKEGAPYAVIRISAKKTS